MLLPDCFESKSGEEILLLFTSKNYNDSMKPLFFSFE